MTVLLRKSTCIDCIWRESCQRLARIEGIADNRDSIHNVDVFEVIILSCSLKNYDRTYSTDNNGKKLFFCTECNQMHHEGSRIGINHKAKMEDDRQERMKEKYLREGINKGENFKN